MTNAMKDREPSHRHSGDGEQQDASTEDNSAASAGSESPEEGQAAMDAAEDAVQNSDPD